MLKSRQVVPSVPASRYVHWSDVDPQWTVGFIFELCHFVHACSFSSCVITPHTIDLGKTRIEFPVPTQRYKLAIAYRGTIIMGGSSSRRCRREGGMCHSEGHGFDDSGVLQRALASVVRHSGGVCGGVAHRCCVHAKRQHVHFDTEATQIRWRSATGNNSPCRRTSRASIEAVPDSLMPIKSASSQALSILHLNAAGSAGVF